MKENGPAWAEYEDTPEEQLASRKKTIVALSNASEEERAALDEKDFDMMARAVEMLAAARVEELLKARAELTDRTPRLTTRSGVRRYIAQITKQVKARQITGSEARVLLYSAQLALSSIKGDQGTKRKPGRPRKEDASD